MAPRHRLISFAILLTAAFFLSNNPAPAQTLSEGWSAFEARYDKARRRVKDFFQGTERVDSADKLQVEAIDLHAKFYTYGVYLQNLDVPVPGRPEMQNRIDREYKSFESDVQKIAQARDRDTMQPLGDVFRDRIRVHALEVLQFDKARPVHKLHNARLLAKIAELGQGALAETLITVLKDPTQNDAVRYYVLRGMGTLLSQSQPMQMAPALNKNEETKTVAALIEFLEQRKGPSAKAPREEIDGFRILRREAIRSLAQCRIPALDEKTRPALILARVAGFDERFQPVPRIDERMEASLGLARLQTAKEKLYQPDYAAGQIAKTIGAFAQAYDAQREQKDNRTLAWRVEAAQLNEALAVLGNESGKNPFVAEVVKRGSRLLQDIIKGGNPGAAYADDETWLGGPQSDPPSKELFQGVADSVVKPGKEAEDNRDK